MSEMTEPIEIWAAYHQITDTVASRIWRDEQFGKAPSDIHVSEGTRYVRGDIADDMLHELERLREIVSDEDVEYIDRVISKAKLVNI